MPNPLKASDINEDPIYINGGPVYDTTLEEMGNMPELLRSLNFIVVRFGSVVVRPPNAWEGT